MNSVYVLRKHWSWIILKRNTTGIRRIPFSFMVQYHRRLYAVFHPLWWWRKAGNPLPPEGWKLPNHYFLFGQPLVPSDKMRSWLGALLPVSSFEDILQSYEVKVTTLSHLRQSGFWSWTDSQTLQGPWNSMMWQIHPAMHREYWCCRMFSKLPFQQKGFIVDGEPAMSHAFKICSRQLCWDVDYIAFHRFLNLQIALNCKFSYCKW